MRGIHLSLWVGRTLLGLQRQAASSASFCCHHDVTTTMTSPPPWRHQNPQPIGLQEADRAPWVTMAQGLPPCWGSERSHGPAAPPPGVLLVHHQEEEHKQREACCWHGELWEMENHAWGAAKEGWRQGEEAWSGVWKCRECARFSTGSETNAEKKATSCLLPIHGRASSLPSETESTLDSSKNGHQVRGIMAQSARRSQRDVQAAGCKAEGAKIKREEHRLGQEPGTARKGAFCRKKWAEIWK